MFVQVVVVISVFLEEVIIENSEDMESIGEVLLTKVIVI